MKKIITLLMVLTFSFSKGYSQTSYDTEVETNDNYFELTHTHSTERHVYMFTLEHAMDVIVTHAESESEDTYLTLFDNGDIHFYNDFSTDTGSSGDERAYIKVYGLPPGTYYVTSENKNGSGSVTTTITGEWCEVEWQGKSLEYPIDYSVLHPNDSIRQMVDCYYYGNDWYCELDSLYPESEDMFFKFTLQYPTDVSFMVDSEGCSSLHLLDTDGNCLYHNNDGDISSTLVHTEIAVDKLPAGDYYLVFESYGCYTGIIIRTGNNYKGSNANRIPNDMTDYSEDGVVSKEGMNSILTIRPRSSYSTITATSSAIRTKQYFNGLGYPEQTVEVGASPAGNDIVTLQEYDRWMRESKTWMPVTAASGNDGAFLTKATVSSLATSAYGGDTHPYTRTRYDNVPQSRPTEQYGTGEDWHKNDKAVRTAHLTNQTGNDTLNCVHFIMQGERGDTLATLTKNGNYATGELFVVRTTDEDGNRSFEFTDKLGRKVLSRRMNGAERLDTYYLYNEYDELLAVLPPVAADYFTESTSTTWTTASCDMLDNQAYLYKYDYWHRVHGRKLPGAAWEIQVRDTYGRITFTQNGEQRTKGEWSFAINDAFNRPCLTGVCYNTDISMATLQANTATLKRDNTNSVLKGYTLTGITLTNPVVHSVNYYDDYSFIGQSTIGEFNSTAYNYEAEAGYGIQNGGTKGMLTGTLTATLNGNTVTGYQPSVMYYDYRGRLIQTKSGNHLSGVETEKLALDFTGNVTKHMHKHTASGETTQTEVFAYTYDHVGRLLTVKHTLNGGAEMTLTANEYDELGRLKNITHNEKANLKTGYNYNVRAWITGTSNPLYSQTLTYGYGGNVNTQQWVQDSKTRSYAYTYDGLSRLTNAAYTGDGNYTTNYAYDKMGNIISLQRYDVSLVDNLTYTYNGNQLTKVEDATENAFGFRDGANVTTEYFYDHNGNLTKDLNKNITNISYNSLSLPSVVTFSNGNTITYTYAADGRKLRTVHVIDGDTTTTDYCGNVIYENGTAKLLLVEGGYVDLTDNSYHFFIKDHLGNNRIVADANGNIEESNQYYPFGLSYASANSNVQPYKYNGKELDSKSGLNWYDYGARYYDAALGRWFVVDPLAEKYSSISPYAYCIGNPMKYIDPNGKDAMIAIKGNTITITSNIVLTGSKATQELAQSYQKNIMDNWGKMNTYVHNEVIYDIVWNVNVRVAEEGEVLRHDGTNNFMEVTESGSKVGNTNEGKIRGKGWNGKSLDETNPMAHEFGHMLGLKDKYQRIGEKDYITLKGWKGNIMGELSGEGKVEIKNLDIILPSVIDYFNSINNLFDIVPWFNSNYLINKENRER